MKWMALLYPPLYHPQDSYLQHCFLFSLLCAVLSVTANVLQTTIAFAVHIALAVIQANVNGFQISDNLRMG